MTQILNFEDRRFTNFCVDSMLAYNIEAGNVTNKNKSVSMIHFKSVRIVLKLVNLPSLDCVAGPPLL